MNTTWRKEKEEGKERMGAKKMEGDSNREERRRSHCSATLHGALPTLKQGEND